MSAATPAAPVYGTLRIIAFNVSVETIHVPGTAEVMQNVPGHCRYTIHAMDDQDHYLSFDVEKTTFERFFQPMFPLLQP